MPLLPINLDISGLTVVIVGGGAVAHRKCLSLLAAGARVIVIAPELTPPLALLAAESTVTHQPRPFAPGDLTGAALVFAATDSRDTNAAVARDARSQGIPVNVADAPEAGTFTLPAVLQQGDLQIAVATGGRSPALARAVRDRLIPLFGPEYALTLRLLGKLREKLLTDTGPQAYNNKIFNELVDHDLPGLFRDGATATIDNLLVTLLGPGFTLAELGIGERDPL